MKIAHRVPEWVAPKVDSDWAERVEREAIAHTDKVERKYLAAQRRLARTKAKAEAATSRRGVSRQQVQKLWKQVEARRQEMIELAGVMQRAPSGSVNRGKGSHRGVPGTRPL